MALTLLIVDDEPSIRLFIQEALSEEGHAVDVADSGDQALEYLAKKPYDAVVTDIRMAGGISGIDLLGEIKSKYPIIEVVIMTSYATLETATQALRLGAYEYLMKPIEDLEILFSMAQRIEEKLELKRQNLRLMQDLQVQNSQLFLLNEQMAFLYRTQVALNQQLEFERVMERARDTLAQLPTGLNGELWFIAAEGQELIQALFPEGNGEVFPVPPLLRSANWEEELEKKGLPLYMAQVYPQRLFSWDVLVSEANEPLGIVVLFLGHEQTRPQWLDSLLILMRASFQKAWMHRKLQEKSMRDGLTGLYNHRTFQERLHEEINRAQRGGYPFSLLFCDVDHFKKFNDTYGHPEGDALLVELAHLLQVDSRPSDGIFSRKSKPLTARYGGEEFVVLLPLTDENGARIKAERIRESVVRHVHKTRGGEEVQVTISLGLASYPKHASERKVLIKLADDALYKAKNGGRNLVVSASEL